MIDAHVFACVVVMKCKQQRLLKLKASRKVEKPVFGDGLHMAIFRDFGIFWPEFSIWMAANFFEKT